LIASGPAFAGATPSLLQTIKRSSADECRQVAETLCRNYKKKGKSWYEWCLREQYANCMHQNPPK
ncbi:hypothetical protein, partial [Streptomyces sp. P17]|uniref:hypothetical protein n=1 Tax=Streptomyces sp. P17 TaxID=3074716 RepID=UPI0028F40BBC